LGAYECVESSGGEIDKVTKGLLAHECVEFGGGEIDKGT